MTSSTLFTKLWDSHVVDDLGDGWSLLHIDRHLLHDLSGPPTMTELQRRGLTVHDPDLAFATPDHLVSSAPDRTIDASPFGGVMWDALRTVAEPAGIRMFDIDSGSQGIVHVIAPEQGIVLPGHTVICGDSHTCTNGALGALAFGVGTSQSTQALATQVLAQQRPKEMRFWFDGALPHRTTAKDLALTLVGGFGPSTGSGFAIEYAGPVIDEMDMESRLTLCNLTVELGAKYGVIAPDVVTTDWLRGRAFAPEGTDWDEAMIAWGSLVTDGDAIFDREETVDCSSVTPMVTWGTSPGHALPIDSVVPDPADAADEQQRLNWNQALDYMGLRPGEPLVGLPVDRVFIGSCANSRLSDLRSAAQMVSGRHVATGVTAWVVPGSEAVRAAAEREGLDEVFRTAGFEWRAPGCSMCVAANGDRVPAQARCVSTSNRNFVGRQGPGARTHLASPAMAAAAAVAGHLVDVRTL